MRFQVILASVMTAALAFSMPALGQQRIQFPTPTGNGLRPVGSMVQNTTPSGGPTGGPVMVPLNSSSPLYPSTGLGTAQFDAYSTRQVTTPNFPQTNPYATPGSVAPSLGGAPPVQPGVYGPTPNF